MVDFLVAVEDPLAWHRDNFERGTATVDGARFLATSRGYSFIGRELVVRERLGRGLAQQLQDYGAGVWYNTDAGVRVESGDGVSQIRVKYGIVAKRRLIDDLRRWETLFLAGRLQKPVEWIGDIDSEIADAQRENLRSALAAGLLLVLGKHRLPDARMIFEADDERGEDVFFKLDILWKEVVGLSYYGDVRVGVAEDPNKIAKIVGGSRPGLEELYLSLLPEILPEARVFQARKSSDETNDVLVLPAHSLGPDGGLDRLMERLWNIIPPSIRQGGDFHADLVARLEGILRSTVRDPSWQQTVKGVVSADPSVSVRYALEKVRKRLN